MFSVALVGPDGAGKSTVSRALAESAPFHCKAIYMGENLESGNFVLPTSRLAGYFLKRRRDKVERKRRGQDGSPRSSHSGKASVGKMLWSLARLANFLAEEWYRQLLSWAYQMRGYVVLYDRHFLFDYSLAGVESDVPTFEKCVHSWILRRLYPRPNLVIYLDAPAEVLYARKGEKTVQDLENRRQAFLLQGTQVRNFVRVDSTQPLDKVCSDVSKFIAAYSGRPDYETSWRPSKGHGQGTL